MDNAKLLWRSKVNGIKYWSCTINSWEDRWWNRCNWASPWWVANQRTDFDVHYFEERATWSNSSKSRSSSENSIIHMEARVEELDIPQKIMLKLFSDRTKDSIVVRRLGYLGFTQDTQVGFWAMEYYFPISFYFIVSSFVIFCHQLYLNISYIWDALSWSSSIVS